MCDYMCVYSYKCVCAFVCIYINLLSGLAAAYGGVGRDGYLSISVHVQLYVCVRVCVGKYIYVYIYIG